MSAASSPQWNENRPYLLRVAHLIDARLRSYSHRCESFETEAEALAALALPFGPYEQDGHVCRFERIGYAPLIARRKRGKKVVLAKRRRLIECPRCNEADERSLGANVCGLCECSFIVTAKRNRAAATGTAA